MTTEGQPDPSEQRRCRVAVVGAGIAGLTTAYTLTRRRPDLDVQVIEAGDEVGGTARTEHVDGYALDAGPNGFLTSVPETLDLVAELGADDQLVSAAESASLRFLWHRGRLEPLPMTPPAFLKTPLLSVGAKLRVACEVLLPRGGTEEETVHGFASRRLGGAFADAFIRPMVLGITGGDAARVEVASLFPRMVAMEQEHRSLFLAMRAKQREARQARRALPPPTGDVGGEVAHGQVPPTAGDAEGSGPAGPGGRLTTLRGGMGTLTRLLGNALGERVRTGRALEAITRSDAGWSLTLSDGSSLEADAVVMAIPAWKAAALTGSLEARLKLELDAIPSSGIDVFALGWTRASVAHALDGFGFLVPRVEGRGACGGPQPAPRILGCLWTSSFFPHQAPKGRVLLRVMAGGDVDPGFLELGRDGALAAVLEDLRLTLGISSPPELVRHVRWREGIPQYRPGHAARVERVEKLLQELGPIWLTGNSYRGVGVNDCVRDGRRVADAVSAAIPAGRD